MVKKKFNAGFWILVILAAIIIILGILILTGKISLSGKVVQVSGEKFAGKTYAGAMLLVNGEPLIGNDGITDPITVEFPGMPVIKTSGKKYQDLSSVSLTLAGLNPSFTYYIYTDSFSNVQQITSTVNGTYTWTQDLTQKHRIWFQTKQSTYHIDASLADGGDCGSIGTWNSGTNTCTLTTDLTETVVIDSSSTTLDCDEHSITGSGIIWGGDVGYGNFEGYGIYAVNLDSVSVKNCAVGQWSNGIYIEGVTNALLEGNVVSGSYFGIDLMGGSSGSVIDNEVINSIHGMRIQSAISLDMSGNNLHDNTYNLFLHNRDDMALQNWNIDTTNTVDGKLVYYLKNKQNEQINPTTYPNAGMIACINCDNVVIRDYDFSNAGKGIWLHGVTNSQVLNVGGQDIRLAIDIFGGGNNIIDCNNKIWEGATTGYYDSGWGIMINSWNYEDGPRSDNNVIRNCQVSSSYARALQVGDYASNNIYENNQVRYFSSHQPAEFWYPFWFHLVMVSGYDAKYNIFRNNVIDTTGMPGGYSYQCAWGSCYDRAWGRLITSGLFVWGGYGWDGNYDPAARTEDNTFEHNNVTGLANGIGIESYVNKNHFAGNIVTNSDNVFGGWISDTQGYDQDFSMTDPNYGNGKLIFWASGLQNADISPSVYPNGLATLVCYNCKNVKIHDFNIESTSTAVFAQSDNIVLSGNIMAFSTGTDNIALRDSTNSIIENNEIIVTNGWGYPINFYGGSDNAVINNKIHPGAGGTLAYAIWTSGTNNLKSVGNEIDGAMYLGIYLGSSYNCLSTENNIKNSGAWWLSLYSNYGGNNKFWHNNFVDSTVHANYESTSMLDLGTNIGGNYWTNHLDCGGDRGDGICNNAYSNTLTNWIWGYYPSTCPEECVPGTCEDYPQWSYWQCITGTVTSVDNYPFVNQSGWRKFRDDFSVNLHIIDKAKSNACLGNAGSCKLPILGAIVKVFDRNDADFKNLYTKNPAAINYSNIFEADVGLTSMCITGSDGKCSAWEMNTSEYLVIVRYYASDIDQYLYTGLSKSPSDFDKKGVATKKFEIKKTINKDGTLTYDPKGKHLKKLHQEKGTKIKCTRATKDCHKKLEMSSE